MYDFVENLFLSAFPEDERRDIANQRRNVDNNPLFCCYVAEEREESVGFITVWRFTGFCYVEHFAIDPMHRNGGYGRQTIQALLEEVRQPVVLEVELPENELSCRRIGFYQRQGFCLWSEVSYIQPAYRPGGNTLPMHLMATAGLHPETDFERVKDCLYRKVYGVLTLV